MSALCAASAASAAAAPSGEAAFRGVYKELVETNTALSSGSCTLAAERMAAHLRTAGFPDSDLHLFAQPGHPKEGGLVAVYPGRDPKAKAMLLLAHLDVVEAKREDWTRDPFTLVEENGNFYARGSVDDKAEAAIWVDTLVRFRGENFRPRRTIKLALTCGEEGALGAVNGAQWLTENHRDWIDAAFAINEGARGELDADGHRVAARGPGRREDRAELPAGGHQLRRPQLAAGARTTPSITSPRRSLKIGGYTFPAQFTDGNRAYFTGMAKIQAAKGNGRGGQGHDCAGARSERPAGDRAGVVAGPGLERDPAHDLRGHHARRRACDRTPCRSARAPTSTAASFPAWPSRACAPSWKSWWRTPRSR